jgi:hypothetical protein
LQWKPVEAETFTVTSTVSPAGISWSTLPSSRVNVWVVWSLFVIVIVVSPETVSAVGSKAKPWMVMAEPPLVPVAAARGREQREGGQPDDHRHPSRSAHPRPPRNREPRAA